MGLGFKDFAAADVLTAAQVDGYLMRQSIMVFASTAARDSATSGYEEEGMHAYVEDIDACYVHDGTDWAVLWSQWGAYTPSWTNLSVGNGTVVAAYRWEQRSIHVRGQITFGSTTSVTGAVSHTVPASKTCDTYGAVGTSTYNDSGTGIYSGSCDVAPSSTSITFLSASGQVNTTVPFTWATGDVMKWDIVIPVTAYYG